MRSLGNKEHTIFTRILSEEIEEADQDGRILDLSEPSLGASDTVC